jgi:UDP-2-acetamido-2,6-beta-L-arabino-hexul-4-ose reductase
MELELLYIDDLVESLLDALEGKVHRCNYIDLMPSPDEQGRFCYVPNTHHITLGEIADLLLQFKEQPRTLQMPDIPDNSFAKKLFSTYLSYLPKRAVRYPLKMNVDERGSFTEILKTQNAGQVSVNVSRPGIIKGQHWHHSKWELFVVVSGRALIQQRRIGSDEVLNFEVSGEKMEAVHMLPGYTHNIINLSDSEDLVTIMWASEPFDPAKPDTYFEKV